MELPIPHQDIQKVQGWLGRGDWAASEEYLAEKYPQHRTLIREWLRASKSRSEGNLRPMGVAA